MHNPAHVVENINLLLTIYCRLYLGKVYVVGGYVRRLYEGSDVSLCDIDLWFKDKHSEMCFRDWYVDHKTSENEYQTSYEIEGRKFQVLPRKEDDGSNVVNFLNRFDYRMCQLASDGLGLVSLRHTLNDIEHKAIVPTDYLLGRKDLHDYQRSLCRLKKYILQGYAITTENMVSILNPFCKLVYPSESGNVQSEIR